MTTLLERCRSATADLGKIAVLRQTLHQRAALEQRVNEWQERLRRIRNAEEIVQWTGLDASGDSECSVALAQLRGHVGTALNRMAKGEDPAALTADALWKRLVLSAERYASALNEAAKANWGHLVESHGVLETPTQLRSTVAKTPVNQQAIGAYERHYVIYRRLADQSVPRTADDVLQLRQVVKGCRDELQKIEHDVPEEVKAFFRAVYANVATLSLLTPGVLDWLRENRQLEQYAIRSVGQ